MTLIQYLSNFHLLIYAGIFCASILLGFAIGYLAGSKDIEDSKGDHQ